MYQVLQFKPQTRVLSTTDLSVSLRLKTYQTEVQYHLGLRGVCSGSFMKIILSQSLTIYVRHLFYQLQHTV